MNYHKGLYWIFTGLLAAFMLMASIPDVLRVPQAVEILTHLGYPPYLLQFLGAAKVLGVVAVLVPSFRRLKEWAYAGLAFDLIGALYSHVSVGDPPAMWAWPLIGLALMTGSYGFYRSRKNVSHRRASPSADYVLEANELTHHRTA
jgi:hypothetical protein